MDGEPDGGPSDVTVNLDGLWLLQALLDIATLAPELRARPYGSARANDWLPNHPGVEVLRSQGLLDGDDRVAPGIANQLAVLAAPDVEVAVLLSRAGAAATPVMDLADPATWRAIPEHQLRIVLARRDGRWVSAARAGEDITIDDVAGGGAEWLAGMITGLLDAVHPVGPSRIPALNVPIDQLVDIGTRRNELPAGAPGRDALLGGLGVRGAALAELAALLDDPAAEALMYARAYTDGEIRAGGSVLDLRDTDAGRVAVYRLAAVRGSAREWMTIAPATAGQVEQGVRAMLASVDVPHFDTHRRHALMANDSR